MLAAAPCAVQYCARLPLLAAVGQKLRRISARAVSRNRTIAIHSAHAGVGELSSSSSIGSQPSLMARIIPPSPFSSQGHRLDPAGLEVFPVLALDVVEPRVFAAVALPARGGEREDETRWRAKLTRRVMPLDPIEPRRRRPAREGLSRAGRSIRTLVRLNSRVVYQISVRQDPSV